jgi:PAS domain S-box-containing protein/putative nucleotidyltransferase with HDIG domain
MPNRLTRVALRTSLLFVFFAALWLVVSGTLQEALVRDGNATETLKTYNPWAFVVVTAFLIYGALRRQMRWLRKESGGREQAEQQVRESEERFSTVFRSSPVGITLSRLEDGRFVDVNPAFLRMVGYARDESVGRTSLQVGVWDPEDRARVVGVLRSQGKVEGVELRFWRKSGEEGTMLGSGELIRLGGEDHMLAMVVDITERKRTEAQLRESEERYRIAIEHSNDGVALIRGDIPVYVNQKLLEIFGYERREEIAGKDFYISVHPDDREMVAAFYAKWQRGEPAPSRLEFKGVRKDGTTIFAEISMAISAYQGEPIALVYVRDTTERKEAEEALSQTERKYRSIFEHALEGIFQITPQGKFVSANPSYVHIYGYESAEELMEELKNGGVQAEVNREDYQEFVRLLEEKGFVEGYERQRVRKDGTRIWVRTNARAVRSAVGDVLYYEGTIEDVTARREAEDALLASQLRLSEAMDLARIVHWEVDLSTGEFVFNDPFYAFYGTTAEREGGYRMSREEYGRRFVHPDDMWVFRQVAEKRLASRHGEFIHDAEHRIVRRDGEVRHVLARIRVSRDATGRVTRYYGANQDITERKQAAEKLESTLGNLRKAIGGTIQAIVQVVEMRDPYTAGHQRRVADLSRSIATEMGLPSDVIEGIRVAAVIHDIGKVAVPAEILSKPGKLTQNELELIKDHPLTGYDILKDVEFPWPVAEIIYQHHERLDGSGYPRGLKGDDVLLEARIIALADVVEAMASHRPFRPARGIDAALDEIRKNRGILYDPEVVDTCVKLFREKGYVLTDRDELPIQQLS